MNPSFFDHIEPSITIQARKVLNAEPVYTALNDPQRFSLPYGPAVYMVNALFCAGNGDLIFASKLAGIAAALLALLILWLGWKKRASGMLVLTGVGYVILTQIAFRQSAFCNRPDSLMVLGLACGVSCCRTSCHEARA